MLLLHQSGSTALRLEAFGELVGYLPGIVLLYVLVILLECDLFVQA